MLDIEAHRIATFGNFKDGGQPDVAYHVAAK
jgi:hypothetical protein